MIINAYKHDKLVYTGYVDRAAKRFETTEDTIKRIIGKAGFFHVNGYKLIAK